jgi:hypothetical protein
MAMMARTDLTMTETETTKLAVEDVAVAGASDRALWMVVDCHTQMSVSTRRYERFAKANAVAERLNQSYGAVRYAAVLDTH